MPSGARGNTACTIAPKVAILFFKLATFRNLAILVNFMPTGSAAILRSSSPQLIEVYGARATATFALFVASRRLWLRLITRGFRGLGRLDEDVCECSH
jgi:hypothetical protein